jgi:hypothetical protein
MNETTFDSKIREASRLYLPGSTFFKFHDMATKGIPDIAITFAAITSWLEDKYWRKRDTLKKVVHDAVQVQTVIDLGARACFVIFKESPKGTGIFTGLQIRHALESGDESGLVFHPDYDLRLVMNWIAQNSLFHCDRKIDYVKRNPFAGVRRSGSAKR